MLHSSFPDAVCNPLCACNDVLPCLVLRDSVGTPDRSVLDIGLRPPEYIEQKTKHMFEMKRVMG